MEIKKPVHSAGYDDSKFNKHTRKILKRLIEEKVVNPDLVSHIVHVIPKAELDLHIITLAYEQLPGHVQKLIRTIISHRMTIEMLYPATNVSEIDTE